MNETQPLVVAVVTADTTADLIRERDRVAGADLVELRLDTVRDADAVAAIGGRKLPVIATCRATAEGGHFGGPEAARRHVLETALAAGAEYVDLEWRSDFIDLIRARQGRGIVLSHHVFDGVPSDLAARADAMLALGCEITKIAVMPHSLSDMLPLLEVARRHSDRRMVLIAMGDVGLVTRVFAARFGSCWTYAGAGVAPGQITVAQLQEEFRIRRVTSSTQMFGLFGHPIGHSLSPALHNAGFEDTGVDAAYVPLPTSDVGDALRFARATGMSGASVTVPLKVGMARAIDGADRQAAAIGAVNTLVERHGSWRGTSTDGDGFIAGFGGRDLAGARVAVLGTGGAARAVASALRQAGAMVTVFGRERSRAMALAETIGVAAAVRPVPKGAWDVLVNATPVGTWPHADAPAFPEATYDGRLVYDLVYAPPETRLLREARHAGCEVIGGLTMLVEQARAQQHWWTGRTPGVATLQAAAERKLLSITS